MSKKPHPLINLDRCNICGDCVTGCPEQALTLAPTGPVFNQPDTCTYCTECENLCPTGAIRAPLGIRWALDS